MINKFINKILGDQNAKILKKLYPLVNKIKEIESQYQKTIKDQNAVLAKTSEFKERVKRGETIDEILPEAFALVKTACRHLENKSWEIREKETKWGKVVPFDVQLLGGIVLHQGNIAEMKTGEGKTLVSTMPVYLNALTEKGVFIVTVNDYLAKRDSEWMGGLFNYLGLSVGVTTHDMTHEQKKEAYNCDVIYGTNNEFGFDYLRDNMATNLDQLVQRKLHYAIVDEVDSILIDEARTPLIISAPAEDSTSKYQQHSKLIENLQEKTHFIIDEKNKTATLTEKGIAKMEELLGMENIYTEAGFSEVHHIEQALRAKTCYQPDKDYIVKDDEIIIIDEFTGRLMAGRRYSHGLHQAIEAKEKVEIKKESKTLATVSFQNYFRLFDKLSGMTGTAKTEEEEFYQIYGLNTIVIPTHKPIVREDKTDVIYKNFKGKFEAVTEKIKELHKKGQPVLVGTISVEKSEILSKLLKLKGIPHNVLNAKQHEREAEIISCDGEKGAVTIATNMAGRGTDIKITEEVKKLGGLFVLGSERHESRRIDNQLRGRSGRQGDPGTTQFFVSMEDNLMRLFGAERIKNMMETFKLPENTPIQNPLIARSIEGAQKKVEGHHFDIRKHLVEYDDIMNIHRNIIYKRRKEFLEKENLKQEIENIIKEYIENIVKNHTEARPQEEWNYEKIFETITNLHKSESSPLELEKIKNIKNQNELIEKLQNYLLEAYNNIEKALPEPKILREIEKAIFLRANDTLWMEHINAMTDLRENVAFSGYAQKNPLNEYKAQAYEMFTTLLSMIQTNTVNTLFKMDIETAIPQMILQKTAIQKMQTNKNQIQSPLSGNQNVSHNTFDNENPVVVKVNANEPSPLSLQKSSIPKAGRNDPCPCGSGKKYKKCCGKQ